MGYAVRQICNASGIDPYNVVFSIKEENLIDKEQNAAQLNKAFLDEDAYDDEEIQIIDNSTV